MTNNSNFLGQNYLSIHIFQVYFKILLIIFSCPTLTSQNVPGNLTSNLKSITKA